MPRRHKGQAFLAFLRARHIPNPSLAAEIMVFLSTARSTEAKPAFPSNLLSQETAVPKAGLWFPDTCLKRWIFDSEASEKCKVFRNQSTFLLHSSITKNNEHLHTSKSPGSNWVSIRFDQKPSSSDDCASWGLFPKSPGFLETAFVSGLQPVQWLHLGQGFSYHSYNNEPDHQQEDVREFHENPWSCICLNQTWDQ